MIIIDNLPSLHAFSTDDVLLVAVFPKGLAGAAVATGIGQMIGGLVLKPAQTVLQRWYHSYLMLSLLFYLILL